MDKKSKKLPHAILLKKVPQDIMTFILRRQKEEKDRKGILNYSQELTIYKILREVMIKDLPVF